LGELQVRAYIHFWLAGPFAAVLFMRRHRAGWLALAAALTLAACGGKSHDAASAAGPTGTLALFAGAPGYAGARDGMGVAASRLNHPASVVTDGNGNFFVADSANNTIRWFLNTPGGWVLRTLAGVAGQAGNADGSGTSASFNSPAGLALVGTTLYVADSGNHAIRKISFTLNTAAQTSTATVITYAGALGRVGASNGDGATASFRAPVGLALDAAGALYVADSGSQTIRKVDTAGTTVSASVTTIAGIDNTPGSTDTGPSTTALFNQPEGLAFDSAGNLYVADAGNSTIRKIDAAATVTTFAGSAGVVGSLDASGSSASFNSPFGIAVDAGDNLYVSDAGNQLIRRIDTAAAVTTFAGHLVTPPPADCADPSNLAKCFPPYPNAGSEDAASAAGASFNAPLGLVFDKASTQAIYLADSANNTIRAIATDATPGVGATIGNAVSTLVGSPGLPGAADGTGTAALFALPQGMVRDSNGNIYVTDAYANTIRRISSTGAVVTIAGQAGNSGFADGLGPLATFNSPAGIAIDESQANPILYVTDAGNDLIRRLVSSDGGLTWMVDTFAGSMQTVTTPSGTTTQPNPGPADGAGSAAQFDTPQGIVVVSDPVLGNSRIYVADSLNSTLRLLTPTFVPSPPAAAPANGPLAVVTTYAGQPGDQGADDSTELLSAQFKYPVGLAVDVASQTLYVADYGNNNIRKVTLSQVTTIAGTAPVTGSLDGNGAAARFTSPEGIVLDGHGNIFVADTGNNTIRKIDSAGNVTTIAGTAGKGGFLTGNLPALLNGPFGMVYHEDATTHVKNLYVTSNTALGVITLP
jgi:DNA-binding beta-propeller fold protein YncE